MGQLRDELMKQQLQSEINKAKELESQGKGSEAGAHYIRAAAIYRKMAYDAPRESAPNLMDSAAQYEKLGSKITAISAEDSEDFSKAADSMIITQRPETRWADIGGLEEVKDSIKEAIIIPFIESKPDFVKAPRTILLYGPPGTGKTMLAKASSNTLNAAFFEAQAPALLSKYFGESSKLIKALFRKARDSQPSLIFIDEVDSLTMSRDKDISEASRRVLGQFLSEIEGFKTHKDEKVIIIAATNKPWDLDDALLSRFQRKIYIPLPDKAARESVFKIHLKSAELDGLTEGMLAGMCEGYSGREIANVCMEAITAMVREMNPDLGDLDAHKLAAYRMKTRPLKKADFEKAFSEIKPSCGAAALEKYAEWGREFGE